MKRRVFANAGAMALAFLACGPLMADHAAIEFSSVIDSTQGYSSFGTFPAMNNRGDVAFTAVQAIYGQGVFRAREEGEKLTVIARDGLQFFGDDVSMNASGVVAFSATTALGSRALFKSDGKVTTLIADSLANGLSRIGVGAPSINAGGSVAFFASLAGRGAGSKVFHGEGGALTAVATTSQGGFSSFQNAAINAAGTVVFVANLSDGSRGVFTVPGAAGGLVTTTQRSDIDTFLDPVINESGTVGDIAFLLPFDATLLFTANARGFTARNDPANPAFTNADHPSINNRGAVAFNALPDGGGPAGIFLEASGGQSLIPVIRPGDKLFGSIVVKVDLGRFALNDRFQMAFTYALADGRSGIAIASFEGER